MFLRHHGWSVRLVAAVMQAAGSPHRDEVIAVGVDVNRKSTAETRIGGTWAKVGAGSLATASESFDVVHQTIGGDVVRYRVWSPGVWAGEQHGPDLGDRHDSMMLYPRSGTDDVALNVQDDGNDLNAVIWNGTGFGPHTEVEGNTSEVKNQPFEWVWD